MGEQDKKMRMAAVGDIHVHESDRGKWGNYFRAVSEQADVLLLCGDLTDNGLLAEAHILVEELSACSVPVIAVLGNHDYDKEQNQQIKNMLINAKVHVLDGDSVVIDNVGFAGVKGFGGGFNKRMLAMFGEATMKQFVKDAVDESLKLDGALSRLDTDHTDLKKIVLMHYSPITATITGEPEQIFPFLGSSRLVEPINRRQVEAVFHGHAHLGTLQGKTSSGVNVFNVSKSVLLKAGIDPPFYVYEV